MVQDVACIEFILFINALEHDEPVALRTGNDYLIVKHWRHGDYVRQCSQRFAVSSRQSAMP